MLKCESFLCIFFPLSSPKVSLRAGTSPRDEKYRIGIVYRRANGAVSERYVIELTEGEVKEAMDRYVKLTRSIVVIAVHQREAKTPIHRDIQP